MNFHWNVFVDLGLVSLALLTATWMRSKVRFFQRFLIPNALTAGFLLLVVYNAAMPLLGLSTANLETLVFHLLGISFVAVTLRKSPPQNEKHEVVGVSIILLMQHIFQAALGLAITFLLIATILPDLFPGFGLFFPLGFALGPGQALAFGAKWEKMGFQGAPSIGITFATIGFLYACFGGVTLIHLARKRGWIDAADGRDLMPGDGLEHTAELRHSAASSTGMLLTTHSDAIDTLSINVAVVLGSYFLTFLLLKALTLPLTLTGQAGAQFAESLWAITYVFAGLAAMVVKMLLKRVKADIVLDNGALTRISGFAVDYLVAGSLGVVSLVVVKAYWLPILLIIAVGTIVTVFLHLWVSSRIFQRHIFMRTLMIYGAMTGTLPTGLALLRVIDPEFNTSVASDHMYAAGLMFPMAIPFLLMADFPANWHITGNPIWFFLTVGLLAAYILIIALAYWRIAGRKAFARPLRLWFTQ